MKRHAENPIITRLNIPDIPPHLVDVSSVFNPGAVKYKDKIKLMLRVQNRGRETFFLMAESRGGVRFKVSDKPVHLKGIEKLNEPIYHCYDPRITPLDGTFYIMFAMDMESGCHLGLARTDDFEEFDFLGLTTTEDTRNGVLFPEKFNGKYFRLDRPNKPIHSKGPTSGTTIVLSESDNLLEWKQTAPVIEGRFHYWDELIGAGPPPIKTEKGWLQLYHGVATHLVSAYIYQAGVMLLDLHNPTTVIGRSRQNILEPRKLYELTGQVPNVVFPSGIIAETVDENGFATLDSKLYVYYGAADTSVCLAVSTVQEMINLAMNK
jgi:predicted GH43/DUF377 family glycosyl hydrolase